MVTKGNLSNQGAWQLRAMVTKEQQTEQHGN